MAITRGPSIVRDDLVLCLDAKDPNSYPRSGSTWYDLTPNQQNASLSGLAFNSAGYFDFDGTDDVVGPSTFDYDDSGGAFTVCAWVNPDSLSNADSYSAIINRTDSSNHIFSLYMNKSAASSNVGDMSAWIFDNGGTLRLHSASGNCILNVSEWNFCVWRWQDNFGFTFDLFNSDGQVTQTASSSYVSRKDSTSQFTIGRWRNSGFYFNGQMGCVNLYNRKLSNTEVLQNYNSFKPRFGL